MPCLDGLRENHLTRRAHLTGLDVRSVSLEYHLLTNILYE